MPLLKRKPVALHPLPSLSTVLQPIEPLPGPSSSPAPIDASEPPKPKGKGRKSAGGGPPLPAAANGAEGDIPSASSSHVALPSDAADDDAQLERLMSVFRADLGGRAEGRGKQRDHVKVVDGGVLRSVLGVQEEVTGKGKKGGKEGNGVEAVGAEASNGGPEGEGVEAATGSENWRVWDRDCFYIPETGEIFTDFESYTLRQQFLSLPLYQCEVSGKSGISFPAALANEQKEARLLHTRFPRPLKKAVLSSVQFQIEGKLENLADKIYERFVNRFFDDEKVFVDVQGDKYLARIIKTYPPKSLSASLPASPIRPTTNGTHSDPSGAVYHPLATNLNLSNEDVVQRDDPMAYFYSVRLIEEGAQEGFGQEYASSGVGGAATGEEEGDQKWEASAMEVKADKISRDRINFSRAILKRFIRDCVHRDAAVYSPWLLKKSVAARYGIPVEMSDEVRAEIQAFRERQMDKRKRDREDRLGIANEEVKEEEVEDPAPGKKRKKMTAAERAAGKVKAEEEKAREEEERLKAEEERRRKRPFKNPTEDLLVEYNGERDASAGRIGLRPAPSKSLPFGDQFELFLMTWSFLNVMGTPLKLSSFTLDDFESSLYHSDAYATPPLLTEIHACLLNTLVADLAAGHEPVFPPSHTPIRPESAEDEIESETKEDLWVGHKGATTATLRPAAEPLVTLWKSRELSHRDGRRGWQESLVGCLWDRGTVDTIPHYLDNILHLLFEDKPAPTRPTWSTGPTEAAPGSIQGLVPARPEKRYASLHFTHKLRIIAFMAEMAGQTGAVREFLEESTARLTEVRKDQVEVKREWKKLISERDALEPKDQPKAEEDAPNGTADIPQALEVPEVEVKDELASSTSSQLGRLNGSVARHSNVADEDELDETEDGYVSDAPSSSDISELDAPETSGAARRKAMAAAAAERSAMEAERKAAVAKQRAEDKERKAGTRHLALEKKRVADDIDAAESRLHELEHEFRSAMYTLRSRPLGHDRFGNKVWWMDGVGSAALMGEGGKILWGTGRIYVQGVDDEDVRLLRVAAGQALAAYWAQMAEKDRQDGKAVLETPVEAAELVKEEDVKERKVREEGEGALAPGEWGVYDTPEQLLAFISYLNPRGIRELALIKTFKQWLPEIEGGMKKRRLATGLEQPADDERRRPSRRGAGEEEGYMNWKNKRAV